MLVLGWVSKVFSASWHWLILCLFALWEHYLGVTERFAASSTIGLIELFVKRLNPSKNGDHNMEQTLGSVGKFDETYAKGVATASGQVALPSTAFGLSISLQATATLDAKTLIGYIAAKIGGPVPAEVAKFLEDALSA